MIGEMVVGAKNNNTTKDIQKIPFTELIELFKERLFEYMKVQSEIVSRFQKGEISREQFEQYVLEVIKNISISCDTSDCPDKEILKKGYNMMVDIAFSKDR